MALPVTARWPAMPVPAWFPPRSGRIGCGDESWPASRLPSRRRLLATTGEYQLLASLIAEAPVYAGRSGRGDQLHTLAYRLAFAGFALDLVGTMRGSTTTPPLELARLGFRRRGRQ